MSQGRSNEKNRILPKKLLGTKELLKNTTDFVMGELTPHKKSYMASLKSSHIIEEVSEYCESVCDENQV